jgi:hypothetical protein
MLERKEKRKEKEKIGNMLSGANNELVLCCVQIPLGQEE